MTTELLATRDDADLMPRFVVSLDELKRQIQELDRFKREVMIEGEDYGVIPGTPKPTLLKPGAEKLTLIFGLAPTFINVGKVEDWTGGFFHYEEECRLTSKRTGAVVASASGSANTKEQKHRYRRAERVCPDCGAAAIIKGKEEFGGGWLCWRKNGGCGTKFGKGHPEIEGQAVGNIENPEPYDLVNTIKKMAQKRALVAAVLIATGGSGVWTQDVGEDGLPGESGAVVEAPSRPVPPAQASQAQPAQANGSARPAAPAAPKTGRQAAAAVATKPTDTKCELCERMVENASVLKSGNDNFGIPLCVAHYNAALDQARANTTDELF